MADIGELIREVRERMGNPSTDVLPDTSLQTAVNTALAEVSRLMPIYVYKQLDLQIDVAEYTVDEEIVDVIDFWMAYPQSSAEFALDLLDEVGHVVGFYPEYVGMKVFHSPSLMNILEQKWEQWHYRYGYGWEWNPDSRKILVMPPPRFAGKAVYKGTMTRTLDTIPSKYMQAFKDLIRAEAMDTLASAYGGVTSVPIGIGNVSFDATKLAEKAEKLKTEALRKLGGAGGAVVIG